MASAPTLASDVNDAILMVAPALPFILLSFRKWPAYWLVMCGPVFGFLTTTAVLLLLSPLLILFVRHHAARLRAEIQFECGGCMRNMMT